ncbi:MAG TPA: SpoIIE family protein phosphatase [Gaiellaceae bacterium]
MGQVGRPMQALSPKEMAVEAGRRPVEALAEAAAGLATAQDLADALDLLADGARAALGADALVVRVLDAEGRLEARAVAPPGSVLGAELAATRVPADVVAAGDLPGPTGRAAVRAGAAGVLAVPALAETRVVGSIEAVRVGSPFDEHELVLAKLAATQLVLAVRGHAPGGAMTATRRQERLLGLAGDALASVGNVQRASSQAVRIAVEATGARAGALWRRSASGAAELAAADGLPQDEAAVVAALAEDALRERPRPTLLADARLPAGLRQVAVIPLGQRPVGVLQLFFPDGDAPSVEELGRLTSFAARSAHALREGERLEELVGELERTRTLLRVIAEASSRLSLAHTLETAVDRIAELLPLRRVGLYLREEDRLRAAAGRALPRGHLDLASVLLEAMLGPLRARRAVHVVRDGVEPGLERVRAALRSTGETGAVAVPLQIHDELIGLLVAYPRGGALAETDTSLLAALAAQLAVAVQNARLHEQSQQLARERSTALRSAREAGRRLGSLYEISSAFSHSFSLERTGDAIAGAIAEALGVDAVVLRVPDARGELLVPRAVRVPDEALRPALDAVLARRQALRRRRGGAPELLDVETARRLGGAHALLVPFLARGSTVALVPVLAKGELLAELTIVSLDPARPLDADALETARTLAQQAALALENARLHQQLTRFAETMRESLLPQEAPTVRGLDIGHRYEPAAQVELGGDVFDYLELPDGRLAVVLGDVTGHGIEAAADMAMGKFVFRSLARQHAAPSAFLAQANDVVAAEIKGGAFITMAYLTVDSQGRISCAGAGHPWPRLVRRDGRVEELPCSGLALGIAPEETYDEVQVELEPGDALVVYTDGLVESRRDGELYGVERLDAVLGASAALGAQDLADRLVAECRAFAGGELPDDCAIVVIRRP